MYEILEIGAQNLPAREQIPRGKYFYKKVKIIPSKFCNNAKFFPRPKDPKVQKSSNVEKVFTENI